MLLVAVGCATQPEGRVSPSPSVALRSPLPPKSSLSPRVGVEFLATDRAPSITATRSMSSTRHMTDRAPAAARIRVEEAKASSPPGVGGRGLEVRETPTGLPWLSAEALAAVDDPAERFTLHFLDQMIGDDRRRVQHEFGAPALFHRWRDWAPSQGLETHLDVIDREDHALLLSRISRHVIRHPLRKALRKGTLIADLTSVIDGVRESIPLTGEYDHRSDSKLGRLSVKLRPRDDLSPLELTYRLEGWRVGSSPGRLKFGYEVDVSENIYVGWLSHYYYADDEVDVSANVYYRVDQDTRLNVLVSDRIDIVTGGALDPVVRSPVSLDAVDDSSGVLFFVEHLF